MQEFVNENQSSFTNEVDWKKIIAKCDTDKDGLISFEEFFTAASDRIKVINKQNLR